MAITGRFEADFASFQTAVAQADVSLKGFEASGSKVETQLNRVSESLSGTKLIQQATIMAEAVERVGGVSTLTEAQLTKVGTAAQEAEAKLVALGQDVPPGIQKLSAAMADLDAANEKATLSVKDMIAAYVSGQAIWEAAQTAFKGVVDFVKSSVDVYATAEAAQRRLTTAIQAQGNVTPGLADNYLDLARAYQQTTTNSHELITETEALLIQVGNVGPAQMDKALQAVTDLSAGLGIDLRTATLLVGKAFEGHTTTLARYGIVLDATRVKTEGVTYVLDALEAKFGGQAAAEADTYAGKIKQLGNTWDDLKESIGKAVAADPFITAALDSVKQHVDGLGQDTEKYTPTITDYWVKWSTGSKTAEFIIGWLNATDQAMADLNREVANMKPPTPPQFTVGAAASAAQKQADDAAKAFAAAQQEAWKKAADAAAAYQKQVQALADTFTTKALANEVAKLNAALILADKQGGLSADGFNILGKKITDLFDRGAQLTPEMIDLGLAFGTGLLPKISDSAVEIEKLGEKIYSTGLPAGVAMGEAIRDLALKTHEGATETKNLGTNVSELAGPAFAKAAKGIDDYNKSLDQMAKMDAQAISSLSRAFAAFGSAAGGELGTVIGLIGKMTSDIGTAEKSFNAMSEAFSKGNTFAGITNMASGILSIASAAVTAGEAIWNHLFGSAGRDLVTQFATAQGGFDALHAELDALPSGIGESLWIGLTQGVGKNNPQQAQAAIDKINAALATAAATTATFNTNVGNVFTKIAALGGNVDAALQPYLNDLVKSGQLTAANAAQLATLSGNGKPTYDQLNALAQKYNLTLAQMGPSFQTAQIDSGFQTIIDDMDELQRGGVDMNAVLVSIGADGTASLSDLGKQVQTLIDQSAQYGVDVPANMKPAAQSLIDQGLLLDQNGQKITDINQIKFGADMQTSLDTLNQTLQTLIETLTGKGPDSLLGSLNTIGNTVVNPKIQPVYDGSQLPPNAQWAQTNQTAASDAAAGTGIYTGPGAPSAPGVNITVVSTLDGREVARSSAKYIPGVLVGAGA